MRRDESLSYRMRNVFIQLDSYHNLPMMNERPLCEDAERNEIKRRVINRPVALNGLPCARARLRKNRNESISRTLPVQSVTIYKTSFFTLFSCLPFPSLAPSPLPPAVRPTLLSPVAIPDHVPRARYTSEL